MRNILFTIEYDGSRYQGLTRPGKTDAAGTVSAKIMDVLLKMTGEESIEIHYGCRTEPGVHAYAQVANFKTESDMDVADMKHYLNRYLPMDIAVTNVREAATRFHAQLAATAKTYVYRMCISDVPSIFDRRHTYHCFKVPDKKAMQEAAALLTGSHDFKNFSDSKTSKSTVREIYGIDIYSNKEEMQILLDADDFLYNMARIIIGTLLDIGFGVRKKEDIIGIFNGTLKASPACDPKGLYLQEISY